MQGINLAESMTTRTTMKTLPLTLTLATLLRAVACEAQTLPPPRPPSAEELARIDEEVGRAPRRDLSHRFAWRAFVELGGGAQIHDGSFSAGDFNLSAGSVSPNVFVGAGVRRAVINAIDLQARAVFESGGTATTHQPPGTRPSCYTESDNGHFNLFAAELGARLRPSSTGGIYLGVQARLGVIVAGWPDGLLECHEIRERRPFAGGTLAVPIVGGVVEFGGRFGHREMFDLGVRVSDTWTLGQREGHSFISAHFFFGVSFP
jgi:hypothetical protein